MKRKPPFAKQARVPANNPTMYVFVDWLSREQSNEITRSRGVVFLPKDDPADYQWAVAGCGIIIMDYLGLGDESAEIVALIAELKKSGAEAVHYVDFSGELIKKNVG